MNWKEIGDALNNAVRPAVVIMFAGSLCYAYIVIQILTTDAFIGIVAGAFGYFFRAREDEKTQKATTDAVKAAAVETATAMKKEDNKP